MIDYYNLDLECPLTWELIRSGKTKGVFQLESGLGQSHCKKVKPSNIEELADLISIIRPGTLNSLAEDGKSMTTHYTMRKHGEEEATPIHQSIEHILKSTHQIIVYQEQAIKIAVEIGGFTPVQADSLRKAMGKKRADIMAKVRSEFIVGCVNVGKVNEQDANMIFDIIEKSNRYSFNKCLNPNSIVETENGLKTLEDLNVGEKVKVPSNDFTNDEFVEVVNKYDNGEQDLYEVTLESGKTIECTLNHKFLADDGQIRELQEILELGLKIMTEGD